MKKTYIYSAFERFWHWAQAALIIFLGFTGFEIHSSYSFFGFEKAVSFHNHAAIALLVLTVFAIFWHFTTGEWRQYLPTFENLRAQIEYYLWGIFKNAPHPTQKSLLSKLNPLQRLVYLGLKLVIIPLMIVTGLIYLFYRYQSGDEIIKLGFVNIELVATLHVIGAFGLVVFLITHLYLITTGHTPTSNLNAMLTGYEELPEYDDDKTEEMGDLSKEKSKDE